MPDGRHVPSALIRPKLHPSNRPGRIARKRSPCCNFHPSASMILRSEKHRTWEELAPRLDHSGEQAVVLASTAVVSVVFTLVPQHSAKRKPSNRCEHGVEQQSRRPTGLWQRCAGTTSRRDLRVRQQGRSCGRDLLLGALERDAGSLAGAGSPSSAQQVCRASSRIPADIHDCTSVEPRHDWIKPMWQALASNTHRQTQCTPQQLRYRPRQRPRWQPCSALLVTVCPCAHPISHITRWLISFAVR